MSRCCRACSTRFPSPKPLRALVAMMPTTPKTVTKRLRNAGYRGIILTRKNAKPWTDQRPGATARNAIREAMRWLGRKILKKWSGYHRRSLVETKLRCFKLLGDCLAACDFDRQVAQLQVCAAILDRFARLGTPTTVAVIMR
jgi:hypothetical protein